MDHHITAKEEDKIQRREKLKKLKSILTPLEYDVYMRERKNKIRYIGRLASPIKIQHIKKEKFIKIWNSIDISSEWRLKSKLQKYFTQEELNYAEHKKWIFNNDAEYDGAPSSYKMLL